MIYYKQLLHLIQIYAIIFIISNILNTGGTMKVQNEISYKTIYKICSVINGLCKLNLEFIGTDPNISFQLINNKMPVIINDSKVKTFSYIRDFLKSKQPCEILNHTDNFQLSYLSVGFFEQLKYKGTIIVGPFLSTIPDEAFIYRVIEKNKLSFVHKLQLHEYYRALPIYDFNDTKDVSSLMINLALNPFISGNIVYSQDETIAIKKEISYLDEEELTSEIEFRYRIEKEILNAVEKGLKEEALKFENLFHFKAANRVSNNPLRAYKNLAFSFNTLLRTACERGGVSAIYISNLSNKFAVLIENITTMTQLETTASKMISEYCDLVNKYSTDGYSKVIKKAINYINLNFKNPISLNIIADSININTSHLSRQFKKETNMTVTEFINKRRIDEAKFLIEQNNISITEIAFMVGFESYTYFSKVFKDTTSLTSSEYFKKSALKV